jgi:hypothetical protein
MTEIRIPVEFKAKNFDFLEEAVKSLGYPVERRSGYVSFYGNHGRVTIREGGIDMDERDRHIINELKQKYSRMVLKMAAARYAWVLKPYNSKNKGKLVKR